MEKNIRQNEAQDESGFPLQLILLLVLIGAAVIAGILMAVGIL